MMNAESFAEMRLEPRWLLESKVSVFDKDNNEYVGLVVNWSFNGIMISTYEELHKGKVLELELVDITRDQSKRTARCKAEVVWSHKLSPSLYSNGLFVREGSDALMCMIKEYAKES